MGPRTDRLGRAYLRPERDEGMLVCTACGSEFDDSGNFIEQWDYCPACGTRLGGILDEPDADYWRDAAREKAWTDPIAKMGGAR